MQKNFEHKVFARLAYRILLLSAILLGLMKGDVDAAQFRIQGRDTIVDQGGRTLRIDEPFKRIISLYGAHTENLFSLLLDAEIAGVSPHEVYPPRAMQKPVYSYHDDPEKFLAAKPDLVLIRPMIDRGYPQFVRRLENSGITVVSLQPGTIDELYSYWEILGVLTGRKTQARHLIDQFRNASQHLQMLAATVDVRKRVYFEAIHNRMKTFSPDSMAIFTLQTAGGINVAADARPVRKTNIAFYGKERILARAAEIDVYLAQYGAMNTPTIQMIKKEPGFRAIKAIQNNEIYIIDEHIVSRPTIRLLDGILEIGKILYPNCFGEEALKIVLSAKQF
jgi:iron complex transport system substrate-binding protein